jgi:hypothetical protein
MVAVLLIAGIGLLLAGLLTVGYGILLDLSLGNTLILAGAIVACTGAIMLGLWMAVRELQNIARRLGPGAALESRGGRAPPSAVPNDQVAEDAVFPFNHDQRLAEHPGEAELAQPPWHEEAASRGRGEAPAAPEPAIKPRRNLLFSSTSRKERERAQARTAEPSMADITSSASPPALPATESAEAPPVTFDDAWPKPERARTTEAPPARRGGRTPSTFTEAGAEPPQVTVLKSGVVDGMAYSLYSDGSIEAQMPEGMMRFASIDELRSHLDQRP